MPGSASRTVLVGPHASSTSGLPRKATGKVVKRDLH